ncbi:MAG: transglycosylase SLT domain-containing protein [Myxococcales bacterium]|nr:MAG: transglycosylase SLT domain-containing protein [Myxococcales bacterium]
MSHAKYLKIISIVVILSLAASVSAEEPSLNLLTRAIQSAVTLNHSQTSAKPIFVRHCRSAQKGCGARMEAFAQYFVEAGKRFDLDPWLLAAMAFRESGLDPFAKGSVGERGLLQMHPQSPWGRRIRFVKDERYRKICKKQAGACQRELVQRAADLLSRSVRFCDGDLNAALGSYNTGRCGGNPDYARRVIDQRDQLRKSVGLPATKPKRSAFLPMQASRMQKNSASTN